MYLFYFIYKKACSSIAQQNTYSSLIIRKMSVQSLSKIIPVHVLSVRKEITINSHRINSFKYEIKPKIEKNPLLRPSTSTGLLSKIQHFKINKLPNIKSEPKTKRGPLKYYKTLDSLYSNSISPKNPRKIIIRAENLMTNLGGYLPISSFKDYSPEKDANEQCVFTTQMPSAPCADSPTTLSPDSKKANGMESLEVSRIHENSTIKPIVLEGINQNMSEGFEDIKQIQEIFVVTQKHKK